MLDGQADAGIIIHDEQLTYQNKGLIKVGDLYSQWSSYAPGHFAACFQYGGIEEEPKDEPGKPQEEKAPEASND